MSRPGRTRKLSSMSTEEAKKVLVEHKECGGKDCVDCLLNEFEPRCDTVLEYAKELLEKKPTPKKEPEPKKEPAKSEMSPDDALRVLYDKSTCNTCADCFFSGKPCGSNLPIFEEARQVLEEALKGKYAMPDKEEIAEKRSDETPKVESLGFEQTRSFMLNSGYKRCYMCGSSLEGGGTKDDCTHSDMHGNTYHRLDSMQCLFGSCYLQA